MVVRRLPRDEICKTRMLWEKVFHEDSKAYLDFYYDYKTTCNEVYAVEDQEQILAMLHLNPYTLRVGKKQSKVNYVVAVATDPAHRKKGLMSKLLRKSMNDMYRQDMPFVFLEPAAEKIYTPYGFRFVSDQIKLQLELDESEPDFTGMWKKADMKDAKKLALFANDALKEQYQIYIFRDSLYYERLILQAQAEGGGVLYGEDREGVYGLFVFTYDKDRGVYFREPLLRQDYCEKAMDIMKSLAKMVFTLQKMNTSAVGIEINGLPENMHRLPNLKSRPITMIRMLSFPAFAELCTCTEPVEFLLRVEDPILKDNEGIYICSFQTFGGKAVKAANSFLDDIPSLSVDQLVSYFFGRKSLEQLEEERGECLPALLKRKLSLIMPYTKVFLNEVD